MRRIKAKLRFLNYLGTTDKKRKNKTFTVKAFKSYKNSSLTASS